MINSPLPAIGCAVFTAFCWIASPAYCAAPAQHIRMPGPPIQDLMVGTWSIEVIHEPDSQDSHRRVTHGREIWRVGPGGRSLIEEYTEDDPAQPVHEFGLAWWDATARGQKVLWCGDYPDAGCLLVPEVARWRGNALVHTVEITDSGKRVIHQEVFTDISVNSFTQILKDGATLATLKTTTTIHATRQSINSQVNSDTILGSP